MSRTEPAAAELRALAAAWEVPCSEAQAQTLLRYADLLCHWNQRINLTGARSVGALLTEHYPDAFALAKRLDRPARLVDVGSGGGLPAIPLAVLRPQLAVQLCEPIAKKSAFLRTAVRDLGLGDRASVVAARAETLVPGGFDAATSRATFEPEAWLALGRQLVRPGGRVFVLTVPASAATAHGPVEVYGDGRRALVEVEIPGDVPRETTAPGEPPLVPRGTSPRGRT